MFIVIDDFFYKIYDGDPPPRRHVERLPGAAGVLPINRTTEKARGHELYLIGTLCDKLFDFPDSFPIGKWKRLRDCDQKRNARKIVDVFVLDTFARFTGPERATRFHMHTIDGIR